MLRPLSGPYRKSGRREFCYRRIAIIIPPVELST
nr:MAG TPA: hypothetical protein [Caudoviricetes sp.]